MARIQSLNMLLESTGNDYLAELYGKVIPNVQKNLVSIKMKNKDLSGDPASGSVEAKRFCNAQSAAYGTARTAGKGSGVRVRPVTVPIDTDKEIVEELEEKDVKLYGVDAVLERRANNHVQVMSAELDTAFFAAAGAVATGVTTTGITDIKEKLETIIQECETLQNDFVDGVPRGMMNLVLSPAYYGQIRNEIDKQNNANIYSSVEEFYVWHGVKTESSMHLPTGCDVLLIVDGAIAQPVMASQYVAEKIAFSTAYAVSLFFNYGTTVVAPDLVFTEAPATPSTPDVPGEPG